MSAPAERPRLRPILLPTEHGGWGLIGAPIVLGLSVAPTWPGALMAVAALFMFLARQPLKIATKDVIRKKRYPRTSWAAGFALLELGIAASAIAIGASIVGPSLPFPLFVLLTLSAIQFAFDVAGQGRALLPELIGSAAAASFAALITIAGGTAPMLAWILAASLALHGWLAVVYVSRRLDHHKSDLAVGGIALFAVASATAMVVAAELFWPVVAAFLVLAGRALWGISSWRTQRRPQIVGIQEIAYTLFLVAALVLSR